jgi:hypothetical protein
MHKYASESSPGYQQQQEVHHDDAILEDGDATEEEMDTDLENPSNEQPTSVDTPSAVHAASVMIPSNLIKNWLLDFADKQPLPTADFATLFPPDLGPNVTVKQTFRNANYFEKQFQSKLGPASISALALHQDRSLAPSIDPANVLWTHLVARLSSRIPRTDRDVFTAVLAHAVDASCASALAALSIGSGHHPQYKELPIPSSANKLNNQFVAGSYAVLDNNPRPSVLELQFHAYIPVLDSIRNLFGHHLNKIEPLIDNISDLDGEFFAKIIHSASEKGREILANAKKAFERSRANGNSDASSYFPGEIVIWSDGFDPSTGAKNNRGGVWCLFGSFCTPQCDAHSGCNTFLIAIGPSNVSHEEVEKKLCGELNQLVGTDSPFTTYHGRLQRIATLFLQIYVIIQDRPERSSSARISSGNSLVTGRWGYAGMLMAIHHLMLQSCEKCFQEKLMANRSIPSQCDCCNNWSFDNLFYAAPEGYPEQHGRLVIDDDGNHLLKFSRITIQGLRKASNNAFTQVAGNAWTKSEGIVFLKTEGILPDLIEQIMDHAASLWDRLSKLQGNAAGIEALQAENDANPEAFRASPFYPATWSYPNTDICDWIDTIMHQLFLGVTRTMYKEMILDWYTSRSKGLPYLKALKNANKTIENLKLSWAKARPIVETGTFSGNVSENFVWMARGSKWLHGLTRNLPATDAKYQDPDREYADYTVKMIKAWYSNRNLPYDKEAGAEDIREDFQEYLEDLGTRQPPPIFESESHNIPSEVFEALVVSLLPMLARVMVSGPISEEQIQDADRHIKIFLSNVEKFDAHHSKRKKPLFVSCFNFVSLLNLPECMRRYGSLRLLWEGDGKGEGAIRCLKRLINNGLKGRWAYWTAMKYLKERSVKNVLADTVTTTSFEKDHRDAVKMMLAAATSIIGELDDDDEDDEDGGRTADSLKNNRLNEFFQYPSIEKARNSFISDSTPLSVLAFEKQNRFGMVIKGKHQGESKVRLLYLKKEEHLSTIFGAAYFSWSLENDPVEIEFAEVVNASYCLLLPLSLGEDQPVGQYLITSDWREMLEDGSIQLSQVPGAAY